MCQVREEAVAATREGDEPSRAAAEEMVYTVSSLKVRISCPISGLLPAMCHSRSLKMSSGGRDNLVT